MRILQINSANNFGGGEQHLIDLTGGLQNRGHQVFIALRSTAAWRERLEFAAAENLLFLPLKNALDVLSAKRLADFIKRENIEIVHAHLARDYQIAALAVRLSRTSARLVLTRHVLFEMSGWHKWLLPRDTTFIAVSRAVQAKLLSQKIVAPDRIKLVYNAIDTRRFARARAAFDRAVFLEKLTLPEKKHFVGIIGEIVPNKGQQDFIRAAARVAEQHSDVDFLIVGADNSANGKHKIRLEQLIEQLNLRTRVHFVGWQPDVAEVLGALEIFVAAAHTESFGLAVVEAMAAGLPIVAAENAGAGEILIDGETGKLVAVGDFKAMADAIGSFLSSANNRRSFAQKAQTAAREKFDLSKMIDATENVYRTAAG